MKKLLVLLGMFHVFSCICALNVSFDNSLANMMERKTFTLRVELDEFDAGVYHESLRFSIDVAGIELKQWHASIEPVQGEGSLSRNTGTLYKRPFSVDIFFSGEAEDEITLEERDFSGCNVYVSCLLQGRDGRNYSKSLAVPFPKNEQHLLAHSQQPVHVAQAQQSAYQTEDASWKELETPDDEEKRIFDQLVLLFGQVALLMKRVLTSDLFACFYILLFAFFCIKGLRRWIPQVANMLPRGLINYHRGRIFLRYVMFGGVFYILQVYLPDDLLLMFLACFFFIFGIFCIRPTAYSSTFMGKLKLVLGIVFLMLVVPLLTKAWLIHFDK